MIRTGNVGLLVFSIIILTALSAGCARPGINENNTTAGSRSIIEVQYQSDWLSDTPAHIEAIPADGSAPVRIQTSGSGNDSLEVKPGISYQLKGRVYDPWGQNGYLRFTNPEYQNAENIIVSRGQIVNVTMDIWFVHPPKSIYIYHDPVTGQYDIFKPSVPVTITGHVYMDNRPVHGALVEAYVSSFTRENPITAFTNESGAYVLTVSSRNQYTLSASYNGLSRTAWPLIVQDNTTGVCDLNIPWTIISTITGVPSERQGWLAQPGNVITARPVGGGKTVTATSDGNGSYSLDVKPFTFYDLSGQCKGPDGQTYNLSFHYTNGVSCEGFMLRENETVFVNYYTIDYRPP